MGLFSFHTICQMAWRAARQAHQQTKAPSRLLFLS
jgi:hypothetical protein